MDDPISLDVDAEPSWRRRLSEYNSVLEHDPIDIAIEICDSIFPLKESLRHDKHAKLLKPLYRKARKLLGAIFEQQKADTLSHISEGIHSLVAREASDEDERKRAMSLIPERFSPLSFPVDAAQSEDWDKLVSAAITRAGHQLAEELGTDTLIADDFRANYLRDHSLQKLTGDLGPETIKRLRNAVADVYSDNATYQDIVDAIEETFDDMTEARAQMIAQTELNTAYNAGRNDLATNAGMNEHAWITESGDPCIICEDNEGEGWIPIEQPFSSGDLFPVGHPNCMCSCDFRLAISGKPMQ